MIFTRKEILINCALAIAIWGFTIAGGLIGLGGCFLGVFLGSYFKKYLLPKIKEKMKNMKKTSLTMFKNN